MKRKLAILICLIFFASGVLRIFAGGGMMGMEAGWWVLDGEFAEAMEDTHRFFSERTVNLVCFTPFSYFGYIVFMGLTISLGALGQLWRKDWGLVLIGIYLLSHGALFVNFMEINPKIYIWGLSVFVTLVLIWANRQQAVQPANSLS